MNKVILQLWEESVRNSDPISDGCTLHIDINEKDSYINNIYKSRAKDVPEKYERIVGPHVEVFVEDGVFEKVKQQKTVKLSQVELNNLIKFEELFSK